MADAGLKLGVEGEREFKKALSGINEEMKLLGSEMKLVASEFDANDKSVKALKSQYNVISSEVDTQRKKVDTLKDALEAASTEFGENDKRTQSWKKQLNLATAELNKMESGLDDLKDELNDARMPSARLGEAIDGIKEKFSDFMKWPKRIGNELKTLTTPIAKVGSGALTLGKNLASVGKTAAGFTLKGIGVAAATGTAALTGLATAAISAANNVAAAGDQIDKESQKLNMSREAYQEWSYVLSQNGADIAQLGGGMDALVMKMNEVEKGNEEVTAMFGQLGISMKEVQEATPEEAFEMVVRGLQGMEDETRKAAIAQELLGGAGAELMPLLNSTAYATEMLKREAHDMGMVLSDEAVDAAVKYTDSMDQMKRTLTNVYQESAAKLLPGLKLITDGIAGMASGQNNAEKQIGLGIRKITDQIVTMIPELLGTITQILPQILDALMEALPELTAALVKAVGDVVVSIGRILQEKWPELKEAGMELIQSLGDGIKSMVKFLSENKSQIYESGVMLLEGLWAGIKSAAEWLISNFGTIMKNLIAEIPNYLHAIKEKGPEILKSLWQGINDGISWFIANFGTIFTEIGAAFEENWPAIKEAGLELVHGLWEGIKGAGAWLWEQLSGWASGIVGDIKDFFGIQSPSKVFAGIGGYLAEGLGVGFEKEMDAVSRQMREAVPTQFDASIDARLRTTQDASRYAYMERGIARNGYPEQQTIVLQVGEREFGRIVVDASDKEYVRRGVKVVTL